MPEDGESGDQDTSGVPTGMAIDLQTLVDFENALQEWVGSDQFQSLVAAQSELANVASSPQLRQATLQVPTVYDYMNSDQFQNYLQAQRSAADMVSSLNAVNLQTHTIQATDYIRAVNELNKELQDVAQIAREFRTALLHLDVPSIQADLVTLSNNIDTSHSRSVTLEETVGVDQPDLEEASESTWYQENILETAQTVAHFIFSSAREKGELSELSDDEIAWYTAITAGFIAFHINPIMTIPVAAGAGKLTEMRQDASRARSERLDSDEE